MADIREQDLALKTTIADTDWIRLVNQTGNHRMTVGQFKDLIGYTQAKSDISQLQSDVSGNTSAIVANNTVEAWKTLPLVNGWTVNEYARYYKHNGRVYVEGYVAGSGNTHFATMPVGYRATSNVYITGAINGDTPALSYVFTGSDGRFLVPTATASGNRHFNFSYRAV